MSELTADAIETRPASGQADPRAFVREEAGLNHLDLMVRGATCAGCISRVEGALLKDDRVETARLNLSTGRLRLSWSGPADLAASYVNTLSRIGYPASAYEPELDRDPRQEEERRLLRAMAVAGFAMANVMLLSVSVWSGDGEMSEAMLGFMHRLSALIVLPAAAFAGQPFFRSAWTAVRHGHVNMDVPISLAVFLACGLSVHETFFGHGETYYDAAAMLLFFLLIGRYLDMRLRARASEAARGLAAMQAASASRVRDDGMLEAIPARDVRPGDVLHLAPGDKIPVDGVILSGASGLDTALVTGETAPLLAEAGTDVFSGMVNLDAPLRMRATAERDNSLLAEIARLVEAGEQGRSRYVRLADQAAKLYVPVVHTLAALTFVGWYLVTGDLRPALINAIAVLIITCPCALGLAVPAVQVVASGRLFRVGVLVKSGDALERLAGIDAVVFDKTGTLTEGRPRLINQTELSEQELQCAASLARTSRHPLSRAVADAAGMGPVAEEVSEMAGGGLVGRFEGRELKFGSADWLGIRASADAVTEAWLQIDDAQPVCFKFEDVLRPDAAETVAGLKGRGLHIEMLSGDREGPAADIAARLGLDHWRSGLKPQDKIARLNALRDAGHKVLMVGDGLNDAPALAAADVSVSLASAAEISQAAADLVLQGNHLDALPLANRVAIDARRRVLENFGLAAAYNCIAVPLAVAGFVTPLIAAIAMSASSVLVTLNALRLASGRGQSKQKEN